MESFSSLGVLRVLGVLVVYSLVLYELSALARGGCARPSEPGDEQAAEGEHDEEDIVLDARMMRGEGSEIDDEDGEDDGEDDTEPGDGHSLAARQLIHENPPYLYITARTPKIARQTMPKAMQ
jgi:hypothetical protein